ncbi:MAG: PDDEXK nuclease domain-containing protein [Thermoleophilia bacterium]
MGLSGRFVPVRSSASGIDEYLQFFSELKMRIARARQQAYKTVNRQLISRYWEIGAYIVERQERLGWGMAVVEQLSRDLSREMPDARGFPATNLWYMRKFCRSYRNEPILQQLVGEIPWSSNMVILDKVSDPVEREYCSADFQPEHAGKMSFYLNVLDDTVRREHENPSIGIILCKLRDRLMVENALRRISKPMGVAKYSLTKALPPHLSEKLPSVAEFEAKLHEDR